ncbi:hypothetical protein P7K49_007008 [Saguinus oedipus]|uniref:60S ribosomal protein L13a n=1 Tax=Saguinus oedipus TaxID=9490 RepID=A0ABQ9W420_SAGOE|nr:hypothetical protein P7K49_007008 [Saguinus oedipus]
MAEEQVLVLDGRSDLLGFVTAIMVKQARTDEQLPFLWHLPLPGSNRFRAPSRIFRQTVRHASPQDQGGRVSWYRLKLFDGIPPHYDRKKADGGSSCPQSRALEATRKFSCLGHLAHKVGWKYQTVTTTLEEKRKEEAKIHYRNKKQLTRLWKLAEKDMEKKIDKYTEVLTTHALLF